MIAEVAWRGLNHPLSNGASARWVILWYNFCVMTNGVVVSSLRIFLVDVIRRTLFWPLWWYSVGLRKLLTTLAGTVLDVERRLGVGLWWRTLFVPMYGQSDWVGRLISFWLRLLIGLGRSFVLLMWLLVTLAAAALWLVAPIAAGYFVWRNLAYYGTIPWLTQPYGKY